MSPRTSRIVFVAVVLSTAALMAQSQPRFDLRFGADRISMEEVARFLPALQDVELPPELRITRFEAQGPLEDVTVVFSMASPAGSVEGRLVVDARSPRRTARGSIQLRGIELARLLDRPNLPESVTADATFDLRFGDEDPKAVFGTFAIESPAISAAGYTARAIDLSGRLNGREMTIDGRALAYGATIRTSGNVAFGDALGYDLRGTASNVNLQSLPRMLKAPRARSDLDLSYQVSGSNAGVRGRIELAASELAGASIADGTTITFDTRGRAPSYSARGRVANLDLQRVGTLLDIEALSAQRFAGAIDAQFDVAAQDGVVQSIDLTVDDAELFGGRVPRLVLSARPSAGALRFTADGRFEGLDPGVMAARDDLEGTLTGTLSASGTIPRSGATPQFAAADARGTVTLGRSSLEGSAIESATIVAALVDGVRVEIEQGVVDADAADLEVAGVYGLGPSVPTDLRFRLSSPALAVIGDLAGQPLSGSATIDGTVTGTDVLQAAATIDGERIGYRTTDLRDVSGRLRAALPREDFSKADVSAHLEAGEIEAGGRQLGQTTADVTYADRRLTFDVASSYDERTIASAGRVVLHPDHQEVHITRLSLGTPSGTWRLAEGAEAAIEYGESRIAVEQLRLVSAPDQSLTISGTLGDAGSPLRVTAANVQLADFAPFIGQPTLEGVLDAEATVRGEVASPMVSGTFDVSAASYRGLQLQTVGGQVEYGPDQLTFDVRLVRPDQSWLSADGAVPRALLTGATTSPGASMNVVVRSSPIGLQLVSAFTDQVTDVAGSLQIDATIGGTLDDPDLDGLVAIRGGAFSVPQLGTRYTGLDTTILLQPDDIVVENVRLVDDDGDWLAVSGRLPTRDLVRGNVTLDVRAESFEFIDNELADLEADMDLRIAGDLRQPDVSGTIELAGGRVFVDEILEMASERRANGAGDLDDAGLTPSSSAPGPTPTTTTVVRREVSQPTPAAIDTGSDADQGLLQDLPIELDVRVRAPNLLLAGTDLQAPGNLPVGLGNVNVTAAGDLHLLKQREGPLRIEGEIETVRGTYEFQNREFELLRGGSIRFTGAREIDPLLDITATRTITAVETMVNIGGTLRQPRLNLSSNPPLDQADILSLVVFNQPTIQLGAGERVSLARRAAALGAGFLAGEISEALGDAFGLDMVDIDAGPLADEGFTPIVTVGERLGNLFVRFRQQVGAESASQVVIEYGVTDWFRVESSFTDRRESSRPALRRVEGSGIDAVFSWEFGGQPSADTPAPSDAPAPAGGEQRRRQR